MEPSLAVDDCVLHRTAPGVDDEAVEAAQFLVSHP